MSSSDAGVTDGAGAQREFNFKSSEYVSAGSNESGKLGQVKEDDDDELVHLSFNDESDIDNVENENSIRESERKLVDGEDHGVEFTYYEEDHYTYEDGQGSAEEEADVTGV